MAVAGEVHVGRDADMLLQYAATVADVWTRALLPRPARLLG
jgi:hypothetical protein